MKFTINKIINFVYPQSCYLCKESLLTKGLCFNCYSNFKTVHNYCIKCGYILHDSVSENSSHNLCISCLTSKPLFDSFHYEFVYTPELYNLIAEYKYADDTNLANFLSGFLNQNFEKIIANHNIDLIIPMPIHLFKMFKRQYNHMALIAKILSKRYNYNFNPFILKKIKSTKDQVGLNSTDRRKNLKGAFAVNKKYLKFIKNKNILLIDDVVTTGTTIKECTKVLKAKGVREVHILTIARVEGSIR